MLSSLILEKWGGGGGIFVQAIPHPKSGGGGYIPPSPGIDASVRVIILTLLHVENKPIFWRCGIY